MRSAVIDERSNGHQLRKLAHTAEVIRMEVRDEQVVDLRNAGVTRRSDDAVRVARQVGITGAESFAIAAYPASMSRLCF
jgi:hypothetical protein